MIESYNSALAAHGLAVTVRLSKLYRSQVIIRRHEAVAKDQLDDKIIANLVHEISDRLHTGEIGTEYANMLRRKVERFVCFVKNGEVKLPNPLIGARTILMPGFQSVVARISRQQNCQL